MYLPELVRRILDEIDREDDLIRRMGTFALPMLIVPLMALTAGLLRGGWQALIEILGVMVVLAQCELLIRPQFERVLRSVAESGLYLPLPPTPPPPRWHMGITGGRVPLPALAATLLGLALFVPSILAQAAPWQKAAAAILGLTMGLYLCRQLAHATIALTHLRRHYAADLERRLALAHTPHRGRPADGLLDPALLARLDARATPAMRLSPAAQALLRLESYLLLRGQPDAPDAVLNEAASVWAAQAAAEEQAHWLMPPVGGKIYLPCRATGLLAGALSATARRLGLDGAYSGTLRTWLVRLPPARSYTVQARLIDALAALGMFPTGAPLIHHLTIAGDIGDEAPVLTLIHLLATPLIFEQRPGHSSGDERPFIMSGGGIIDDLDRGARTTGPRTDFVDGFLLLNVPDLQEVEHLAAHGINLRVKQVLAWAVAAYRRPPERRTAAEEQAALRYERLRADLHTFLARYGLEGALTIHWRDGLWSEQWPVVEAISGHKQRDHAFLPAAQALRDAALDDIERITAGRIPTT